VKFILVPMLLVACARPQQTEATPDLQSFELARVPSAEVRALLRSKEAATRTRAALAAGRLEDVAALPALEVLLRDSEAGATAAWALGRIEGGQAALTRCIDSGCSALHAAARNSTEVEPLLRALQGPAADEAGIALGLAARAKAKFPENAAALLAEAFKRAPRGAVYALSRLPKAPGVQPALEAALNSSDPWIRALAARAWGRHGLPAAWLPLHDPDLQVRVEAARALANAADPHLEFHGTEALGVDLLRESPHVVISLLESAAALTVLAPEPSLFQHPAVRCAAAVSRDRVRKQVLETARSCGTDWHGRARAGALATDLELQAEARKGFADEDGRVRAATAGAASLLFADDLRKLLQDPDPYVVQNAAMSLAKDPAASREAALEAVRRLSAAHVKPSGDPRSDALISLIPLAGRLPLLLPTPNTALALALGEHVAAPVPTEQLKTARVLRLRTSFGELVADLRTDVAPVTSAALAALARRGFYDGLDFHRVVADFVVQGGDPRGDGDGGPGWAVPDENSPLPFERGTLGIATNGPETGGSQFFFCHAPAPHLEGHYTVAGRLRPESLQVLDELQPGDKILSAGAE
jgi:cyclophilin family peptidyl-prolyl cis-trans isomerase/HEAT repeat protein